MLKKLIILAVLSAILFSSFSFTSLCFKEDQSDSTVESYYLYDISHNMLMTHENTDKRISPSSTAKIMAACIILESNINLEQEITVTAKMLTGVSGRTMFLKKGDLLTVKDLLYAMLCGGYNDATHILALTVSTTLYKFTEKMNEKAAELGMYNTHYSNPTGITDEGAFTTVDDIAKLAKYMMLNELFVNICSTKSYQLSNISICDYKTITNRSSLLAEYKGLSSFNVGSSDSGDCAVLFYNSSEVSLISIVMNAKPKDPNYNNNCAEKHSKSLLYHALNNYSTIIIKRQQEIITSLPVKYSISSKNINIYLKEDLKAFLPCNTSIEEELTYSIYIKNNELIAPLKANDTVGSIMVFYDGVLITSVPLIVKDTIDVNSFLYSMDMLKQFVLSKTFFISLILFIILIISYYRSRKRKFKRKRRKTIKKPT